MAQAIAAIVAVIILVAMSVRADVWFRESSRLPMQWSSTGSVNWTAPRRIALAFTPVLATCILFAAVAGTLISEPRAGEEGYAVPVIVVLAAAFVAVHALHLKLIGKSLRRNGG